MKKVILLLTFYLGVTRGNSQVLNAGFENLNPNGTIQNWGSVFLTQVTLDSNGVSTSDSIVFDNQLYFSTNDAHSGSKALEMRNAFNYTSNQAIAGRARLTPNDSDYAGFVAMVSIPQRPAFFSFYYKFLPAGPDTAYAYMSISDSNGVEIGNITAEITNSTSVYQLYNQPVVYSSNDAGAFISAYFSTAKPGSVPSFGTRFLVDDINFLPTGLQSQKTAAQKIHCFPNPVQETIYLSWNVPMLPGSTVEITDIVGKIIQTFPVNPDESKLEINIHQLAAGTYFLNLAGKKNNFTTSFIKEL